jgi:hypothetical protein
MSYEIHVTVNVPPKKAPKYKPTIRLLKNLAKQESWATSQITDDPVLGPGNKFYFTAYRNEINRAVKDLNMLVDRLYDIKIKPLRQKIELIILDSKTNEYPSIDIAVHHAKSVLDWMNQP